VVSESGGGTKEPLPSGLLVAEPLSWCCVVSESGGGTKELLQPGLLVAEPFSWKSLATGDALLRIRTTGTQSSLLSLPEGSVCYDHCNTVMTEIVAANEVTVMLLERLQSVVASVAGHLF